MATIRADSYSSVGDVAAMVQHLLRGTSTFNLTSKPTQAQVVGFIDEASALLNSAIAEVGFAPATLRANGTAKLACDAWVRAEAVQYSELTIRGQGYGGREGSRTDAFDGLFARARQFARDNALGWKRLNITVQDPTYQGVTFTGMDRRADRADKDNTAREQPKFRRSQWDNN